MEIFGKNSILEAIKNKITFNKLYIDKNLKDNNSQQIINLAKENCIKIEFVNKQFIEYKSKKIKSNNEKINHQGFWGEIIDFKYCQVSDIINESKKREEDPFILILDGIEDPHNLGAIIRTAECSGVHGIIIPEHRACLVNETVIKTSAGAISNFLIARVNNLSNVINYLKQNGLWIFACETGGQNLYRTNLQGPVAIIMGSEGRGVSRLVKEQADDVVTIPMFGKINSLNVSVATGIVVYEVVKQRHL